MTVFVDTSALYALVDAADPRHVATVQAFRGLADEHLLAHSYVALEATALVQNRLGLQAVQALRRDILPAIEVIWVDAELDATAVTALLAAGRRDVSLVDRVSFELMRRRGITRALAIDADFVREGFTTLP